MRPTAEEFTPAREGNYWLCLSECSCVLTVQAVMIHKRNGEENIEMLTQYELRSPAHVTKDLVGMVAECSKYAIEAAQFPPSRHKHKIPLEQP